MWRRGRFSLPLPLMPAFDLGEECPRVFRFCRCQGARRLTRKINTGLSLDALCEVASMACVKMERFSEVARIDLRRGRQDVSMNSDFERCPRTEIEAREAQREFRTQNCQCIDCRTLPGRWRLR